MKTLPYCTRTPLYWACVISMIVITFIYIDFFVPDKKLYILNYVVNIQLLFERSIAIYIISSIYIIKANEVGGVSFMGIGIQSGGGGPRIALLGLMKVYRDKSHSMQYEIPSSSERIWKGDPDKRPSNDFVKDKYGNDTNEQYYVLPLRITTGAPIKKDDKNAPLSVQATVEPSAILRFRIKREKYMFNFIPRIGSMSEAIRQMSSIVAQTLQNELSKRAVGRIITELQDINNEIVNQVRELTESWGIEILNVDIKIVSLSHKLNKALRDISLAKAQALIKIITAEAENKKIIKEGSGTAKALELYLKSEAIGLKEIAESLGIDKKQAIDLFKAKTAETALKEAENLTIFASAGGNGMETLFGLMTELKNT